MAHFTFYRICGAIYRSVQKGQRGSCALSGTRAEDYLALLVMRSLLFFCWAFII